MDWSKLRTPEGVAAEVARAEAQAVLVATDWYVTRAADPSDGRDIPAEVVERRRAARALLREDEADA